MQQARTNLAKLLIVISIIILSQTSTMAFDVSVQKKTDHAWFVAKSFKSRFDNSAIGSKIKKFIVKDDRLSHKFQTEIWLTERISDSDVEQLSNEVQRLAGPNYKRIFVGLRIPNLSSFWATAHHQPNLKIEYLSMSLEEFDATKASKKVFKLKKGENLIGEAEFEGAFPSRVQIIKDKDRYIARTYYLPDGEGVDDQLMKKNGRFWVKDSPTQDNYRITKTEVEFHDQDGLIKAAQRLNE